MAETDIWDALATTDPQYTKGFTRGGGFRGTAISPVYAYRKLTEIFGMCGTGWGLEDILYEPVHLPSGEMLIFCRLNLWYRPEGKTKVSVPGVGGDYVVKEVGGKLRSDDEAYKKAMTDAITNAAKYLGMSADIHMGLFDDSKYVQEVRGRFGDKRKDALSRADRATVPPVDGDAKDLAAQTMCERLVACNTPAELEQLEEEYADVALAWQHDRPELFHRLIAARDKAIRDMPPF